MLILVVGAKGGLGATTLALHLVRAVKGVGLDLADGQLAARLERATWTLARPTFATAAQRREAVDQIVKRRITLLWTSECLLAEDAWAFVRSVADRAVVVADGGIAPPESAASLADAAIIVSADNPVAAYHERRLNLRFPSAEVVTLSGKKRGEIQEIVHTLAGQVSG